jgi:hypothetical protein
MNNFFGIVGTVLKKDVLSLCPWFCSASLSKSSILS